MGFRGKVRNGKGGEGSRRGRGVCMRGANGVCTRASRIASLSTRGYGREEEERAKDEGAERGST